MSEPRESLLQQYLDSKWVKLEEINSGIADRLINCLTSFRPDKDVDNRFEEYYSRFFKVIRCDKWVFGYVSDIAHVWQWELIPMDVEVFWPDKTFKVPYERIYGWITDFDVDNVWNCVFIFPSKLYYNLEKVTYDQLSIEQWDTWTFFVWKKNWVLYYLICPKTKEEWWNWWYLFSLTNWTFIKLSDLITTEDQVKAIIESQ